MILSNVKDKWMAIRVSMESLQRTGTYHTANEIAAEVISRTIGVATPKQQDEVESWVGRYLRNRMVRQTAHNTDPHDWVSDEKGEYRVGPLNNGKTAAVQFRYNEADMMNCPLPQLQEFILEAMKVHDERIKASLGGKAPSGNAAFSEVQAHFIESHGVMIAEYRKALSTIETTLAKLEK